MLKFLVVLTLMKCAAPSVINPANHKTVSVQSRYSHITVTVTLQWTVTATVTVQWQGSDRAYSRTVTENMQMAPSGHQNTTLAYQDTDNLQQYCAGQWQNIAEQTESTVTVTEHIQTVANKQTCIVHKWTLSLFDMFCLTILMCSDCCAIIMLFIIHQHFSENHLKITLTFIDQHMRRRKEREMG